MKPDQVPDREEKFFFDQNIFDEHGNIESEIEEDLEPPPPMFNEAELEAAKKAAFQEGHRKAKEASEASIEKHLTAVMDSVAENMAVLFASEAKREKIYEREVVTLVLAIFETLFPHYYNKHGLEELRRAVASIIEQQSGQQAVCVMVHPDMVAGINEYMKKLQAGNADILFTVQGDANLEQHACRLAWKNGGAVHDIGAMAASILEVLKDGLAGSDASSHDRREENIEESATSTNVATDIETADVAKDDQDDATNTQIDNDPAKGDTP